MAKHYHKGKTSNAPSESPEEVFQAIQCFLRSCRRPAALDAGSLPIELREDYALEIRSGRVWIDIWQGTSNLSRRILSVNQADVGVLDCSVQKFGAAPGKFTFLDLDKPQTAHRQLTGSRQNFGEQFRRMLYRQFPGWEINQLSSAMDLQRSFSPVFPRARLTRRGTQIAAMACPEPETEPTFLTFALLWFDYCRQHPPRGVSSTELSLFLPEGAGCLTAHRLHWLTGMPLRTRVFLFNQHGSAGEIDTRDLGNLETRVSARYLPAHLPERLSELLKRLTASCDVDIVPELTGELSIRHQGLEFARIEKGELLLGLKDKQRLPESHWSEVISFAQRLCQTRPSLSSVAASRIGGSERWLESVVRANLALLEPSVCESPVHGQVITFAGLNRDQVDLLAANVSGTLVIFELKVSEDIHLPLQALDYWMRVLWHCERGELDHLFPSMAISKEHPHLRLVAPALAFHSTVATLLKYFSPDIPVQRIGINSDWSTKLKVVLRLDGAELPQSHGWESECAGHIRNQEGYRQPEP